MCVRQPAALTQPAAPYSFKLRTFPNMHIVKWLLPHLRKYYNLKAVYLKVWKGK